MTTPILFEELSAENGKRLGVITLNTEETLNALTLPMVNLMLDKLRYWQGQEELVCVLIKSIGDKAFCAGGDVRALYQSAMDQPGGPCEYAEAFFTREYRLDYLLHTYSKPVICWGHGIVMGGGLGVMAACSHRVATEKTRIAMPEITIALYPDVGGSWFLNRMPANSGIFLALTGASINAVDSVFTGLADYVLTHAHYDPVLAMLLKQPWSVESPKNHALLSELLRDLETNSGDEFPDANVEPHLDTINQLCGDGGVTGMINNILTLETTDPWLAKARDSLAAGSPLSALIIYHQLQLSRDMTLAQVFQAEVQLSTHVVRYPEFSEGVRALLIDKDRNPQWQFKTVAEVPADFLKRFFIAPQQGASWPINPLADL